MGTIIPSLPADGYTIETTITVPAAGYYKYNVELYNFFTDPTWANYGDFQFHLRVVAGNLEVLVGGNNAAERITISGLNLGMAYTYVWNVYEGTDGCVWADLSIKGIPASEKTFKSTKLFDTSYTLGFGYQFGRNTSETDHPSVSGQFTINSLKIF
jgi:hypothetical protein